MKSINKDDVFGRLTVIKVYSKYFKGKSGRNRLVCDCMCSCGNTVTSVRSDSLISGKTTSCGCVHKTHGGSNTRLYRIRMNMLYRCNSEGSKDYNNYGKRGITVCDEWKDSFEAFKEWALSSGYSDSMTLERIDVNGNYSPANCKWVPLPEQSLNKRNSVYITYKGEKINACILARKYGISECLLLYRVRSGWDIDKALTAKVVNNTHYYTVKGVVYSERGIAKMLKIPVSTLRYKLKKNEDKIKVIEELVKQNEEKVD